MLETSLGGGSACPPPQSPGLAAVNAIRYYSVADRILCFGGADESVLNLIHGFLSGYYFNPVKSDEAGHSPSARLEIPIIEIHGAEPANLPTRESGFAIEDGHCFTHNDQILLEVNGSTILVGPAASRRTNVWLSETTAGKHPLALNNVILYAVQAALRRAGMYQFHAGGVIAPERPGGILLVGDSGSGKSTLTATLVGSGWQFVSDDNLLLRDTQSGIVAWALRRYFTFDETTLSACKLLQFETAIGGRVPGGADKIRFYARRAFPENFVESVHPDVILFPEICSEARSRIERFKQGNALARLIRQCPWATCDTAAAPDHLRALANLVKQTRSYSFFAGRDVFENPPAIANLIRQQIDA
jgi:hypothetical protein